MPRRLLPYSCARPLSCSARSKRPANAAAEKLEPAGARAGLQDISDKATALATAPKPKLEDASGINGAVVTAIGCVGGL